MPGTGSVLCPDLPALGCPHSCLSSHCAGSDSQPSTPHTPSLLAAYDACATPKEQEMLLSTIKCGRLQR